MSVSAENWYYLSSILAVDHGLFKRYTFSLGSICVGFEPDGRRLQTVNRD